MTIKSPRNGPTRIGGPLQRPPALPGWALVTGLTILWALGAGAIGGLAWFMYEMAGFSEIDCWGKRGAAYRRCESDAHAGQVATAVVIAVVGIAILWFLTWLILRAHRRSIEADAARARQEEWRASHDSS